jgi:transcriptional regulator GlxA family with amidase domain
MFAGFTPNSRRREIHRVAVLAYDGVVLGDLATPLEIFGRVRDANGRACYDVRVCGVGREVKSEHLNLDIPWRLSFAARSDTVIVPGIDNVQRSIPPAIFRVLKSALKRGARIASICTGAFVLAGAGLLDNLRATTHWMAAGELERRYPRTVVDAGVLYVDNGQVLTSAGAAAGMDLCLHMVRRDHGASVAARVARAAVIPLERSGGQAQFIEYKPPEAVESMRPLLLWIDRNLRQSLSISTMARHARMSTRTLSRRFREQVGMTPARWLGRARVRRARHLLETTQLGMEQIAMETGFGSSSVLRERFGSQVGVSPSAYRRSFGATE